MKQFFPQQNFYHDFLEFRYQFVRFFVIGTVASNIDKVQSESRTKYTDTSKASNTLTSPNRCSTSPSRQNIDKKFNIESKGRI